MKLSVNGDTRDLPDAGTVRDLVVELGFAAAVVAVEVNRQVVPRKLHESTELHDGDQVEIVTLVGGG